MSQPLLGRGLKALEAWAQEHGQAAFRGRQLHDWLYAKGARKLADVSVLPKGFREQLSAQPPEGAFDWMGRSRELHRRDGLTGTNLIPYGNPQRSDPARYAGRNFHRGLVGFDDQNRIIRTHLLIDRDQDLDDLYRFGVANIRNTDVLIQVSPHTLRGFSLSGWMPNASRAARTCSSAASPHASPPIVPTSATRCPRCAPR